MVLTLKISVLIKIEGVLEDMCVNFSSLPMKVQSDIGRMGFKLVRNIFLSLRGNHMEIMVVGIDDKEWPACKIANYEKGAF